LEAGLELTEQPCLAQAFWVAGDLCQVPWPVHVLSGFIHAANLEEYLIEMWRVKATC
jgi:hypothetical protein